VGPVFIHEELLIIEGALMVKDGKLNGTTETMTSFWVAALGEKILRGFVGELRLRSGQEGTQGACRLSSVGLVEVLEEEGLIFGSILDAEEVGGVDGGDDAVG
jgi:hypothetical protein